MKKKKVDSDLLDDPEFIEFQKEQERKRTSSNKIYHIGVSGGKDSTALLLWMVYESGISHTQLVATFCDTQNEADCTYEHIWKLNRVFPIIWISTEGFFPLAFRKGRFPASKSRFCTQELKLKPTKVFLDALSEYCDELISCSGLRRDESEDRKNKPEWGDPMDSYFGLRDWRPLISWKLSDVLAIHRKYDVPLNDLYSKGARRVGCFPCINSSKPEIRAMAKYFPERVEQIADWEKQFENKNGMSTFFPRNKVPFQYRSKTITTKKGQEMKVCTIHDVIQWANSGWRGKGTAPDVNGLFDDQLEELDPKICLSQHLACE